MAEAASSKRQQHCYVVQGGRRVEIEKREKGGAAWAKMGCELGCTEKSKSCTGWAMLDFMKERQAG
jgi:hypothetical protein